MNLTQEQRNVFFLECPHCGNLLNYFETEYEIADLCQNCCQDHLVPVLLESDGTDEEQAELENIIEVVQNENS